MKHKVLIFGDSGQDGQHLKQLLEKLNCEQISLDSKIKFEQPTEVIEQEIKAVLEKYMPTCIFNFAALATGAGMFDDPHKMLQVNGCAVAGILEAIRKYKPNTKFCQASSSEMFGLPNVSPQNETTEFNPRTPYGAAKLLAHNLIGIYRVQYDLFACSAILFNHESSLRSTKFITRKITQAAAKIKLGIENKLVVGNLDARRDWGFAPDYVKGMWLMLQEEKPDDYVFSTGITHSISDLCQIAFMHLDLDYRDYVTVNQSINLRAKEGLQLVGDSTKARKELYWAPSISFKTMIQEMVDSDLKLLKNN